MIEPDKRKAIFLLHQEGMSGREIALRLGVDRGTVQTIVEQKGVMPDSIRKDKIQIDPELLTRLYGECEGWVQRIHEKLIEEEGIQIKYSTLTARIRELGLGQTEDKRCGRVPDKPGDEMQHDTTVYTRSVGGERIKVVASLLYLRYAKRRYLKFYRVFNRFRMKCFFHEALTFWGYAAKVCIIDNTNLARLRGTGKDAVIVPEMEAFAKQYGFRFECHEIGHANRKAGEERSFFTVQTNFLPGRTFQSWEDLNRQALEWSTVRMEHRPQGKSRLIPAAAFEHERAFLNRLPRHLPAPYLIHERLTDQYGYISFDANFYWVPGVKRDPVTVLEYGDRLKIFQRREFLAEYRLPAVGVKNELFSPEGFPKPRHKPNNRKKPAQEEEKRLRAMAEGVGAYLDFALGSKGLQRHRFLRDLFALRQQMTSSLFVQILERALRYRITCMETLQRIAQLYLNQGAQQLPCPELDENFQERDAYVEGRLTDEPDFSPYDRMFEENHG